MRSIRDIRVLASILRRICIMTCLVHGSKIWKYTLLLMHIGWRRGYLDMHMSEQIRRRQIARGDGSFPVLFVFVLVPTDHRPGFR